MRMTAAPLEAPPLKFEQVLAEEFHQLHPQNAPVAADEALHAHADAGHAALCLSGGGVRSASFGLGILQGLAEAGLLESLGYLSTVSGGGYIGGWLSAWRVRAAERRERDPLRSLATDTEPEAIAQLRNFIKFLDPRTGWLGADTWTLAGTIVRNLLVTWLLLIPIVAAAVMVPRLYFGILGLPSQPELVSHAALIAWYGMDWIPILVGVTIASTYAAHELPSLGNRARGTRSFLGWFLVPVLLVEVLFSIHRHWAGRFDLQNSLSNEIAVASIGMVLPWILGGAMSRRFWRPWTWLAAAAAGALGRCLAAWVHTFLAREAYVHPAHYAVFDLPVALALLFLQFTAFVGLASRDMTDEDREWWARAGAWILIAAAVWLIAGSISLLAPVWLDRLVNALSISHGGERAGTAVAALLLGAGAYWLSVRRAAESGAWKTIHSASLALVAPLSVALLIVLIGDGDRVLLEAVHRMDLFRETPHLVGASLPEDLVALAMLLSSAAVLGGLISSTKFSLHDMYRARLVRTFLGASRPASERTPSGFTGFDAGDEMPIDRLRLLPPPLHIVNATMDLVGDRALSVAQTKAASFTMSPLHAGTRGGYRPSSSYAGGLSLGQAMTTSGAAVSPNMGAASSPALTFLLATLNARLGVWLGNPGKRGDTTWRLRTPAFGLTPLVNELLGRTTDTSPYVYLSDGGHFENLALYEIVARRCRYVIVSDAGCDSGYCFDDLANAIRRIRIDFGIPIDFPSGVHICKPGAGIARWAVGSIGYSTIDPLADNGVLVYLKPALTGDEPVDVVNYARSHPAFPQESTVNQWFDTAQFESYRMLGLHTVQSLVRTHPAGSVKQLCEALRHGAVTV
jgi:hypothetical protein